MVKEQGDGVANGTAGFEAVNRDLDSIDISIERATQKGTSTGTNLRDAYEGQKSVRTML